MSCSTSCALLLGSDVSSRSARLIFSFFPPTSSPPASLISLTASSVAALYAPPIFDSFPVTGMTAPRRISSSAARSPPERRSEAASEAPRKALGRAGVVRAMAGALEVIDLELQRELAPGRPHMRRDLLVPHLD